MIGWWNKKPDFDLGGETGVGKAGLVNTHPSHLPDGADVIVWKLFIPFVQFGGRDGEVNRRVKGRGGNI